MYYSGALNLSLGEEVPEEYRGDGLYGLLPRLQQDPVTNHTPPSEMLPPLPLRASWRWHAASSTESSRNKNNSLNNAGQSSSSAMFPHSLHIWREKDILRQAPPRVAWEESDPRNHGLESFDSKRLLTARGPEVFSAALEWYMQDSLMERPTIVSQDTLAEHIILLLQVNEFQELLVFFFLGGVVEGGLKM